jgi:hypothetical protein
MDALKTIGREALGLFIADARFTAALVCWIAIAAAIPAVLPRSPVGSALLLFAGFAAILIENLVHIALKKKCSQH